jgi:hypothetical protein
VVETSRGSVYARALTTPLFDLPRVRVAVVVNPRRKTEKREGRDLALKELQSTPDPQRIRKLRRELGDLAMPAPGRRDFVVDNDMVEEDMKGDGRFLMFSTDMSMDAVSMLTTYY